MTSLARSACVSLLAATFALLIGGGNVAAHARYAASTPARGEVLDASPAQVEITFTQDIQRVTGTYGMEVYPQSGDAAGPEGASVTAGDAVIDDDDRSVMRVALQPALPPGRYVVSYRNVSDADGDRWEGAFSFYVGVQPTEADLAADAILLAAEEEDGATPTPRATAEPDTTPDSSATSIPPGGADNDEGGASASLIITAIVAAIVGVALGFVAYRYFAGKRA